MTELVKVSWKLGSVEMHYEGNEEFLKTELPKLFQELLEIYKSSPKNGELEPPEFPQLTDKQKTELTSDKKIDFSVNNIGARIGIKEGNDLVMAACAHLALVENKTTFSRQEIHEAMKSANHYYNENHTRSLSRYITSLVKKGHLLERSNGVYALSGGKLRELENKLAK